MHVKIIARLKRDEDGYPPFDSEGMWAIPVDGDDYRVDNVPFYAVGISSGDVVTAPVRNGIPTISGVKRCGGHSTLRVIALEDRSFIEHVRRRLKELGCDTEASNVPHHISVDVPPEVAYGPIVEYLDGAEQSGAISYEESCVQHERR